MGLLDSAARVILTYKADTSDAKAKIRELAGEEKKAAQARVKGIEDSNKKLEDQGKAWANAAAKIAFVAGGLAVAKKGLDAYAKTGSEAAAEVAKLTGGISSALDSVLVGVGKAVVAFEPLVSMVSSVVSVLGQATQAVAGLVAEVTKGVPAEFWSDPEGYAKRVRGAAAAADEASRARVRAGDYENDAEEIEAGALGTLGGARRAKLNRARLAIVTSGAHIQNAIGPQERTDIWTETTAQKLGNMADRMIEALTKKPSSGGSGSSAIPLADFSYSLDAQRKYGRPAGSSSDPYSLGEKAQGAGNLLGYDPSVQAAIDKSAESLTKVTAAADVARNTKRTSFLESSFGSLEEFNAYAVAFEMLSGAVESGLGAWIDGSATAGEAIKKFFAEAIKGLAISMAMQALQHGAYAIGSLAFGDVLGAKTHGKAAIMFGIGAVAASAAAKKLHGGGGSGASAGGASAPTPQSYGGGSGSQGPERIIVYSDTHADDTARGKQQRAERTVRRVLGNSATEAW